MFFLEQLARPIVGAPMAGGPSTPALAAAVTNAGGLGFLAAGYKTAAVVAAEIAQTRSLTSGPFGLNIFVPDAANESATASDPKTRRKAVEHYRGRITASDGGGDGGGNHDDGAPQDESAHPDAVDPDADDDWAAKLELACRLKVPVVSFTFGLPSAELIESLQAAGIAVSITVTDSREAASAVRNGADMLCVQGPLAGGHRSTHSLNKLPGTASLADLLRAIRSEQSVPIMAAGGIARPEHVAAVLEAGANAAQVGTALLRSPEAGTSAVHRAAMADPRFTGTTVTRAFSGRWARGITNDFIRAHTAHAPAAYPEVNQLTKALRAAAVSAGDPQRTSLWAGPYFAEATDEPAAAIVRRLYVLSR